MVVFVCKKVVNVTVEMRDKADSINQLYAGPIIRS